MVKAFFLIVWIPFGDYEVGLPTSFVDSYACESQAGVLTAEIAAEQERSGIAYCVEAENILDSFKRFP